MNATSQLNQAVLSNLIGINSLFKNMFYYSKDIESNYLDCSENTAAALNLASLKDIKGKSDDYFGWSKNRIHFLREHDLEVLKRETAICKIEKPFMTPEGKYLQLMSYKAPLYCNDKIIGISGVSFQVESIDLKNLINNPSPADLMQFLKGKFSNRESDVLFHLIRGKSAKEIAEKLSISKRTVESYLENIKNKANALTRAELIEQLIDGFICQINIE